MTDKDVDIIKVTFWGFLPNYEPYGTFYFHCIGSQIWSFERSLNLQPEPWVLLTTLVVISEKLSHHSEVQIVPT